MAKFETFAADIRLATAGMEPAAISAELARLAKSELAKRLESGEASPVYDRYVNGRKGEAEDSVKAPGPILYEFSWWRPIIGFALDELRKRSPVQSGAYRDAHFVMMNGRRIAASTDVPVGAEIIITNDKPYARKIHTGAMKQMRAPPGIYEAVRQAIFRRFGGSIGPVEVQIKFILLPGGYVLKGNGKRRAAKANMRSSAFRGGHAILANRSDTQAGNPLTYPALVMSMKV